MQTSLQRGFASCLRLRPFCDVLGGFVQWNDMNWSCWFDPANTIRLLDAWAVHPESNQEVSADGSLSFDVLPFHLKRNDSKPLQEKVSSVVIYEWFVVVVINWNKPNQLLLYLPWRCYLGKVGKGCFEKLKTFHESWVCFRSSSSGSMNVAFVSIMYLTVILIERAQVGPCSLVVLL